MQNRKKVIVYRTEELPEGIRTAWVEPADGHHQVLLVRADLMTQDHAEVLAQVLASR